jgi:hypothetical protein
MRVDADELRAAGTVVRELVRCVGRDDDDVTSPSVELVVAGAEGEAAFDDDPRLVVGVLVQPRSLARLAFVEDERDGGTVVSAFEIPSRTTRRARRLDEATGRGRPGRESAR